MPGRRALKWFATLAAFVIAAAVFATLTHSFVLDLPAARAQLSLGRGALWAAWDLQGQAGRTVDFYVSPPPPGAPLVWTAEFYVATRPRGVTLPLWAPFAVLTLLAIALWRREYPAGHCPACGYDLTGNVSGLCPECGRPAPAPPAPAPPAPGESPDKTH